MILPGLLDLGLIDALERPTVFGFFLDLFLVLLEDHEVEKLVLPLQLEAGALDDGVVECSLDLSRDAVSVLADGLDFLVAVLVAL